MATLILAIICAIVAVVIYFYEYPIIEVVGDSMFPTYKNGQYLKAHRIKPTVKLTVNHVYVYRTYTGEIVIKRLNHMNECGLFFVGDNIRCSFDSRSYGYIPRENVIAEIINP